VFTHVKHSKWQILQRRTIDVVFASGLVVALAPIMAAMAIATKINGGDSILFHQVRGLDEDEHEITKFRTINDNGAFVDRVGKVFKDSTLDEIAGLFDVLSSLGKRSTLVGRMAWVRSEEEDARDSGNYWSQRTDFPIGWTGPGAITANQYNSPLTAQLEHDYELHWTAWRHIRMVSKTLCLPARNLLRPEADRFSIDGATHIGQYEFPIVSRQAQREYAAIAAAAEQGRVLPSVVSPPDDDASSRCIHHVAAKQVITARELLDPSRFHKVDERAIARANRIMAIIDGGDSLTSMPKRPGLTACLLGLQPMQLVDFFKTAHMAPNAVMNHPVIAIVMRTLDLVGDRRVVVHLDNQIDLPPTVVSRFVVARAEISKALQPTPLRPIVKLEKTDEYDIRYAAGVRQRPDVLPIEDLSSFFHPALTSATLSLFAEAATNALDDHSSIERRIVPSPRTGLGHGLQMS
jgi:lipopolysaccharide/colanic/teichoic acid biosynthesis glycosyltransferase